ncbi:cysteine hydrolase family protein [Ruegeria sp. HKCCD7255]|uniref:cysteine hydrolase family protein n=1 Tax=Ruegeria sp. HKCCD7255 TaxID=2683004 RepID=UPI0014889826|nr:isochorismatase family protein [Ruegeria sp. HKCCD7255]
MTVNPWLLVIDMQPAFSNPESPWFVPGYEDCAAKVARLVDAFGDRVLFTRFVPPRDPDGSWRSYYAKHQFALDPQSRPLWELDQRWYGCLSVASHRFAKWHEASPLVPPNAELVMCGVATDCCVLGTAIEANDDGRTVRLVADACAAATDDLHSAAMTVLSDRAGLLQLTDTDSEVPRL